MAADNTGVTGLVKDVASFQIADEEDEKEGYILPSNEKVQQSIDFRWTLVGKFFTDRFIRLNEMSQVMAMNWRPGKGVFIQEIAPQLFIFQFAHEADVRRVAEGGPWAYDNHLLLFKRIQPGEDPEQVLLDHVNLWVQVLDLPPGFMSEHVAQGLANKIGEFIEADSQNYSGPWRRIMRIRVRLNVYQPLKKSLNVKPEGGQWKRVKLQYERLPTFCFICGLIGHEEKLCKNQYDNAVGLVERQYGPELRASTRRSGQLNFGAKWLLPAPVTAEDTIEGSGKTITGKNQGDHGVSGNKSITKQGSTNFGNGANEMPNKESGQAENKETSAIGDSVSGMHKTSKGATLKHAHENYSTHMVTTKPMLHVDAKDMDEDPTIEFSKQKRKRVGTPTQVHTDGLIMDPGSSSNLDGLGPKNIGSAGAVGQARQGS